MSVEPTKRFKVERHGGRRIDEWRVLCDVDDRRYAEDTFNGAVAKMRQGGVRFVVDDRIIETKWAPRLRSRW